MTDKEVQEELERQRQRKEGLGRVVESPTQTTIGNQILSALGPKRSEFTSVGIDEALQGVGSDGWGSQSWTGLRVPTLPTPAARPDLRYLFQLCSFQLSDGETCRIIGIRNGWSMGFNQVVNPGQATETHRIVEQWVEGPLFKGPDFNISWNLRKLTINEPRRANPAQVFDPVVGWLQGTAFQTSDTPALLYRTIGGVAGNPFYTALVGYIPPNNARPWGRPLAADLGEFMDLKVKWSDASNWHALDIPVVGPARVVFYCTVQQSNPTTRTELVVPGGTTANFPLGLSSDEQFLSKWALEVNKPIVWRVAGALAMRFEDFNQYRSYAIDGGCK